MQMFICDIWKGQVWPWLSWVKLLSRWGAHYYTLWIFSYLDVWSSFHTCGSHKSFNKAKSCFISVSVRGSVLDTDTFKATRNPKVTGTLGIQSSWWQKHMLCAGFMTKLCMLHITCFCQSVPSQSHLEPCWSSLCFPYLPTSSQSTMCRF